MTAATEPQTCSFHPYHLDPSIFDKRIEEPYGVASPTDTSNQIIREPAFSLHDLLFCFLANNRLKVPHHHRIGMRASHRAYKIIGVPDISDPVSQSLTHRILQSLASRRHHSDLRS